MKPNSVMPKSPRLQIRRQVNQDSPLGRVLRYTEALRCDLTYEVQQMLAARFLPAALKADGQLTHATALECIGTLKGYIYAIEQLAGIESSSAPIVTTSVSGASTAESDDDELLDDHLSNPSPVAHVDIDELDRMFGLSGDAQDNTAA